jgi:hypothetical protein
MSTKTMESIIQAGLKDEVDDFVEVESNFKVKKIGKSAKLSETFFSWIWSYLCGIQGFMEPGRQEE